MTEQIKFDGVWPFRKWTEYAAAQAAIDWLNEREFGGFKWTTENILGEVVQAVAIMIAETRDPPLDPYRQLLARFYENRGDSYTANRIRTASFAYQDDVEFLRENVEIKAAQL